MPIGSMRKSCRRPEDIINDHARLYHFALSPFCRKVRLVLAEKKIDVELVEERYWEPSTEFLRRNPAGKVPVLKIDGLMLSDSQAICEYVEETVPEPELMPKDAKSRAEVRRLCGRLMAHGPSSTVVAERLLA